MKTNLIALLAIFALTFSACSDDDDNNYDFVSDVTKKAQAEKYPNASVTEWEKKGDYVIAEFRQDSKELEAWYDNTGKWYMTETDLRFEDLPEAVKTAFKANADYKDWTVDDCDKIERNGLETIYIIDAEKSNQEVDLIYSADGVLIEARLDVDGDHSGLIPEQIADAIKTTINEKYPNSRFIEQEYETVNGVSYIEVTIIHDNFKKDVYFAKTSNEWVWTEWDVAYNSLPQTIKNAISENYASWQVDDCEKIEKATGFTYRIELEKGNEEIKVEYSEDGKEIK